MNLSIRKMLVSEFVMWLLIGALGIFYLYPLRQSLRFGSDLVGGIYLTLEVQVEKALEAELVNKMRSHISFLKKNRFAVPLSKKVENKKIVMTFESMQEAQEGMRALEDQETVLKKEIQNNVLSMYFSEKDADRISLDAVQRNIEVLRTRLDRFSVAEIPIAAQGKKNIVIELPDVADPRKAKEMIGSAANLEFRLVDKVAPTIEDLMYEYDGDLPEDKEILPGKPEGGRRYYYVVQKYADVTGRMLKDTRPALGGKTGVEAIVQFSFDPEGSDRFYELTSKNYGRLLAIVLDGEVISAPQINAAIRGNGEISGNFTSESAKTLSLLLKSGSFVAPVTFEEERHIGPALGEESRNKGILSCLVGLSCLLLFSIYFYRLSGFFAFLALIYNLLLVLIGLAWMKATLTLPGIAGMVLTVGMAIDASILVYERIKEELGSGVALSKAVTAGFSSAMMVILDANITTFIVAIVLYNFGSGPIQGFAVTMMLGIIATLITGLFFLRSIFTFMLRNFDVKKLSI